MPIDVTKLPTYGKKDFDYIWADFIEIKCIRSIDAEISQDDLYDSINEADDLDIQEEDLEETPQRDDKLKAIIEEWFRLISYRSQAYGDVYPFESNDFSKKIKLKENLSQVNKNYIFLLFSSHLTYFPSEKYKITTEFERFGHLALKKLMPISAEVHIFGTSSSNARYSSGTLFEKLQRLAEDFGESLLAKQNSFTRNNNADGGIDHVGWIPFPDRISNKIIYFAQSACSKEEWDIKQHSVSRSSIAAKFTLAADLLSLVFIPFCFRRNDGSWHSEDKTYQKTVVVDRQRLLWLVGAEGNSLPTSILELIEQEIERPA
jgi:hypothetical protein